MLCGKFGRRSDPDSGPETGSPMNAQCNDGAGVGVESATELDLLKGFRF